MVDAVDLCTVADVKTYLALTTSASDARIQALITACSRWVITYCGMPIKSASYNEVYDGPGGRTLMLRNRPITAVASLTVDRLAVTAIDPSTTPGDGFTFSERMLYLTCRFFTYGLRNVRVAYTAGYATVPQDIAQAVVESVAERYKHAPNEGISSRSIAGETVTWTNGDTPASARKVFDLYKGAAPA